MQDYDKAQIIINKNMEYEKEQIHKQLKNINKKEVQSLKFKQHLLYKI